MAEYRDGAIIDRRAVPVSPDAAFRAVATKDGLESWFPLRAEVEPRVGGRCLLSWGEGSEGEAPIHAYEPPVPGNRGRGRFGWTESYPATGGGEATVRKVDFHVAPSGTGSRTTVRMIHSGFAAGLDPETDGEISAYLQGWSSFMYGLEFYLTHHAGKRRRLVWHYGPASAGRDEAWDALVGSDRCSGGLVSLSQGLRPGAPVTFRPIIAAANEPGGPKLPAAVGRIVSAKRSGHLNVALPKLGRSLLFIELEDAKVGVWLSTYGLPERVVEGVQKALDQQMAEAAINV